MPGRIVILILLTVLCTQLRAQQRNLRCRQVPVGQAYTLDSLHLDPGSISFPGQSAVHYDYNISSRQLLVEQEGSDSIHVCYRVFPANLFTVAPARSLNAFDSTAHFRHGPPVEKSPSLQPESLFSTPGIRKTGSISRGLSTGNRQSAFVNSQLNLQLEGQLTDDISIEALISDQQVPYQPEGNTQRLDDFDQVYIRLKHAQGQLTLGDIVLQNPESWFLRYRKNGQGLALHTHFGEEGSRSRSHLALSGARGKFHSEQLTAIDGLSGPYQLQGPATERFVIVLANSEKVWLDGRLLERGFDRDYIIDYNTAEITFSPAILITAYSRIRVDFEYSTRDYARSILLAGHEQEVGRLSMAVNYYGEQDQPNNPLQYTFAESDLLQLSSIGDATESAYISGIDSAEYSADRVLYRRIDTLVEGRSYTAYQRSTHPDLAIYSLRFSDVGPGNGDYLLAGTSTNGRVYRWVAPVNGQPQGDHAPLIAVRTPDHRRMLSTRAGFAINQYETAFAEWALSDRDLNRFSSLDDGDNQGMAWRAGLSSSDRPVGFLPGYKLSALLSMEHNDAQFQVIDRYRSIEFDRNWSFDEREEAVQQRDAIVQGQLSLKKDAHNYLNARITDRQRGSSVNGQQQSLAMGQELGRLRAYASWFHLDNEALQGSSRWQRWQGGLSWQGQQLVPGYRYTEDRHSLSQQGEVLSTANNYVEHELYLQGGDSASSQFRVSQSLRQDRLPFEGRLRDATRAMSTQLRWQSAPGTSGQWQVTANYRHLDHLQADTTIAPEESLGGQLSWQGTAAKGLIRHSLSYGLANSRELRREFVYVPVDAGQGTHTWRDENGDGIQDLNEFYEAINPDERNYARIFVPGRNYQLAYRTTLNWRLDLKAPRRWQQGEGLVKVLGRMAFINLLQTDRSQTASDWKEGLRPIGPAGEGLLSQRDMLRSTLYYNRNSRYWSAELSRLQSARQQLLSQGTERRQRQEWSMLHRIELSHRWQLRLGAQEGENESSSDFLAGRNYQIGERLLRPALSWQPGKALRLTLSREDNWRSLQTEDISFPARLQKLEVEAQWAQASKGNLMCRIAQVQIDYSGPENTQAGYEVLDGLRPGQNQTWLLNWQQTLRDGLRLNLQYNGRKSLYQPAIHTGRVSLVAIF